MHLVGGLVGTLLIGLFSTASAPGGIDGLFYGGGWLQLGRQAAAAGSVMAYSFLVATILGLAIKYTIGFRVNAEAETSGVDEAEHAETGYDYSALGGRAPVGAPAPVVDPAGADAPS